MGKMQRTNLSWDNYIDYLIDAINGSKFMKRAEDKPMATPKTATESHVTTRAIHLRESADIAKRLAKGLGLNAEYIYAAMLMHDSGHPFSAHEGEEIFNYLGDVYNTQYFHHNAKGIEIILSEDLCGKAISKIPNIENNPELRKKLEDEFPYFLDAVISHDGEALKEDMMKPETPYATIEEAVRTKMRLANSENKYKFIAQTPEGRIAKFADVIAYLSSDMQDGFRLGIIKDFSDDYLKMFGEMFSQEYPVSEEDKIDCGRRIIEQMKEQNLREKRETVKFMNSQDEDMQYALKTINKKIQQADLNIHSKDDVAEIQEIVEQEKENFRKKKIDEFFRTNGANIPEEQRQTLEDEILKKLEDGTALDEHEKEFVKTLNTVNSEVNKIEEFATKMLRARSNVVYEVTSKMKEYFINDLLRNSQDQEIPQFSNAGWDLFLKKAKKFNYNEFVQYTNWDYQTQELPRVAMDLVQECSESLIKSGAIRNKFYDEAVRNHIKDDEALSYMETKYRPEAQYTSYRKERGIGDLKAFTRPSKDKFIGTNQYPLMKLFHDVYSYVQNENEVFAIRYENTFNAVKTRVRRKIETALSETHQVNEKHLYREAVQAQVDGIRQEIIGTYGTTNLTPEQKEEFIAKKIEQELKTMEKKMAIQLSTDYLAGMTDKAFIDLAVKTGYLSPEVVPNAVRGTILSDPVQQLMNQIEEEEKPVAPEVPSGVGDDDGR